jgi:hypothetical protein
MFPDLDTLWRMFLISLNKQVYIIRAELKILVHHNIRSEGNKSPNRSRITAAKLTLTNSSEKYNQNIVTLLMP